MAVGFLHVINNMKGNDMSVTATLPHPDGKADTQVQVMTEDEVIDIEIARSERFSQKVKRAWEKTKSFFRRIWNWTRETTVDGYEFARDKVVVPAARWVGRNSRRAWFWGRATAIQAWRWTRPVRGLTAGAVASGAAFVALNSTVSLLIFGVMVFALVTSRRRRILVQRVAPGRPPYATIPTEKVLFAEENSLMDEVVEPTMVLNQAQQKAVSDRLAYLEEQAEDHMESENKPMMSNYGGRLYLARRRFVGVEDKPEDLYIRYRALLEAKVGHKMAAERFIWSHVRKGMIEENKVLSKILDQNATELASK